MKQKPEPVLGPKITKPIFSESGNSFVLPFSAENEEFFFGPENAWLKTAIHWATDENFIPKSPEDRFSYQPILFYGPSGSGKTHLLTSIFSQWRSSNRRKKGIYLSGDDFARLLTNAFASKTVDDFRQKFQSAGIILLDGLDLLKTKTAPLTELQFLLEHAAERRQTVVLSTLQLPSRSHFSDERLLARLIAGLVVPVSLPGLETRKKFITQQAQKISLKLTTKMTEEIAKELPGSIPQLLGFLSQIQMETDNRPVNMAVIERLLSLQSQNMTPEIGAIAKLTAKQFGLKLSDLKGKSRKSTTSKARGIVIYLARQLTALSLKEIGHYFGGRDHTTIAYHVSEVEKKIIRDPQWREQACQIREMLTTKQT